MAEKVEIIITAKDNASRIFGSVRSSLQTLGAVTLGGVAAGFTALAAGLGFAISEASEAQGVLAQTNAVIESTGGIAGVSAKQVTDLATELQNVTKFGDETIQTGENMLLTFTNIGSNIFPQVTEMALDMSQSLGQDVTASAMQLGKALNDPIQGVTALRRVGVQLTDSQEELIQKLMKAGKVEEAQKVILQELQREFGGSARAAGQTFAGQMTILRNRISNAAETVGSAFMPILSELFTKVIEPALPYIEDFAAGIANVVTALFDAGPASTEMREALTGLFGEELGGKIADIVTKVTDFATSVSTFVTETLVPFLSEHGPLLLTILQGVATGLAAFAIINTVVGLVTGLVTTIGTLSAAFTAAGGGIAAVVGLLGGPLTVAIAAIALIVGLFTIAWKNNWFGIRDIVANIWASIQPVFQTIVQWLQTNIPLAIQTLTNFWTNTLLPAIQAIWNFLQTYIIPIFVSLARLIITVVVTAFNILVAIFQNILLPIFRTVFSFISEKLSPVFKVLGEGITKFVNGAGKALKVVFEDIKNIIQTVIDFIQKLIDKIKNIKLPPILQRHSPSPFEMTFIGAAEAIKELTSLRLPALETGLGRVASSSYTSSGEKASPSSLGGSQIVLSVMPGAIVIQAGAGADTRKIADEVLTYLGKDLRRLVQSGSGWVGG